MAIYYMMTGDVCGSTFQSKSMDSPSQQFLDLLDQASWCHVGTAGSSWLHRCGMECHRLWYWGHSSEQLAWQEQLEACFIWVASVAGAADVGCMHGAGGGDAGCAAKKWWLDRACSVAVVPLGTVSAALPLCSWNSALHVAVVCGTIAGTYFIAVLWEDAYHSSRNPKSFKGCRMLQLVDQHTGVQVFCCIYQPVI